MNIVLTSNAAKKPLPRFWYFPRMLKAVVVMTGDDHANGGTVGRFNDYVAFSTPGCSVADWQCIRGTSYIYPEHADYRCPGAELRRAGLRDRACTSTPTAPTGRRPTLPGFYSTQLSQFATNLPHAGAPKTNRTHCVVNSDYATQWQVVS